MQCLEEEATKGGSTGAKATELCALVCTVRFLGLTYFMSEVLAIAEQLSKMLQERSFHFTEVQSIMLIVKEGILAHNSLCVR